MTFEFAAIQFGDVPGTNACIYSITCIELFKLNILEENEYYIYDIFSDRDSAIKDVVNEYLK